MSPSIVLASTSPYRRQLLERLRLPFTTTAPAVDESARPGETPRATAARLALAKAERVAGQSPQCVVIGSDQVADLDGQGVGKPLGHDAALRQLVSMQGRRIVFHTAVALVCRAQQRQRCECVDTEVTFRTLDRGRLDAYLKLEQPYDCAGSARIESLGICLVEAVRSSDPTALIGLPLIALTSMLADFGILLPAG
jgi:septum formation protein